MLPGTEAHQAAQPLTNNPELLATYGCRRYDELAGPRSAARVAPYARAAPRLRGLPHAPGCVVIGVPLPFLASIYERSTDPWRADPRAAAAMGVQPT